MKQTIRMMIMALALAAAHPACAQESASPATPPIAEKPAGLDERFARCMNDPQCTLRERMRLMREMDDDMRETWEQMDQNCMMMDYNECIGPQRDRRQHWRKTHEYMDKMMRSMETRALDQAEVGKPATAEPGDKNAQPAGDAEKRPWWKRWQR